MTSCTLELLLDLLYYNLAETIAIDETIVTTMLAFLAKAIDTKNKYLQYHVKNLIDILKIL